MKQRGFWFKRLFALMAILTFVPVVFTSGMIAIKASIDFPYGQSLIRFESEPFGFATSRDFRLGGPSVMIRNRWCSIGYSMNTTSTIGMNLDWIDPDSSDGLDQAAPVVAASPRQSVKLSEWATLQFPYFRIIADSQKVWLVGRGGEVLELIGDKLEIHSTEYDVTISNGLQNNYWFSDRVFAFNGLPAVIIRNQLSGQQEIFQFHDGKWNLQGAISLLDPDHRWVDSRGKELLPELAFPTNSRTTTGIGGSSASGTTIGGFTSQDRIHIMMIGSTPHLFWYTANRLLYRRGIKFLSAEDRTQPDVATAEISPDTSSSTTASSSTVVAKEWTLIADNLPAWTTWLPVAVGGEPTVVLIDPSKRARPVALAYRLQDQAWTKYAQTNLLFGSFHFFAGSVDDGSKSYLGAVTQRGRVRVVALETDGFQPTNFDTLGRSFSHGSTTDYWIQTGSWSFQGPWNFFVLTICLLAWFQIAGMLLAVGTSILMSRDKVDFEYGTRSSQLASLFSRTIARAIDFICLVAILVTLLRLQLEATPLDREIAFDAARSLIFDEENILKALRVFWLSFFATIAIWFLFAAMQGRWGITPGKLVCGLRVTGTTLLPCGFARSLYREVLLPIDNLFFLSWIPGISRIAFSTNRQRFGDHAADTIVIRSRDRVL